VQCRIGFCYPKRSLILPLVLSFQTQAWHTPVLFEDLCGQSKANEPLTYAPLDLDDFRRRMYL